MLQRVLYVSQAAPGLGIGDVYGIIRASHARNSGTGLSGALLFLDGWFAQILEGPAAALDDAFGRIAADPRHARPELRLRSRALGRLFPGHAMALRYRGCADEATLTDFDYRPGFPVTDFPADVLTELLVHTCRRKEAHRTALH